MTTITISDAVVEATRAQMRRSHLPTVLDSEIRGMIAAALHAGLEREIRESESAKTVWKIKRLQDAVRTLDEIVGDGDIRSDAAIEADTEYLPLEKGDLE